MTTTKIKALTPANIEALRGIGAGGKAEPECFLEGRSATWNASPAAVLAWLDAEMTPLPTKGHPRASLHAVRRKVVALIAEAGSESLANTRAAEAALVADVPVHVPTEGEFRPEPGEQFQVLRGYFYDDDLFKVLEYAPLVAAPEKVQAIYNLPSLPTEAVHAVKIERHGERWVGTARHTFPTSIMAPVGSTAKAFSAANGGASKPRAPRQPGSGRCEHCGEPTKGGRFIPGHDAKLKGDLQREATDEAAAERIIRGWAQHVVDPAIKKLVAQGDGFLRSRIAARIGADPGGQQR